MNARGQNPCGRCLCNTEDEPDECPPRPKVFEVYCPLSSPVFRDYWWSGYAPPLSLSRLSRARGGRRKGTHRSCAQPAYADSSHHVRHMPYGRRAQDRGYLNQQLDRRPGAESENHLTQLSQEQRRHGAGDDAAATAGEWGSTHRNGGNRRQGIVVAGGLRRAADEPRQQQSRHRETHPGGNIGADLVEHHRYAGGLGRFRARANRNEPGPMTVAWMTTAVAATKTNAN